MKNDDRGDILWGCGLTSLVIAGVIALSLIGFAYYWVVYPLQVQRETYAAHQSYGYTTTQQNNLIALMADYQKHQAAIDVLSKDGKDETAVIVDLKAEQGADVSTIKADVQLMDQAQVPPSVTQFLVGK